MLNVVMLSVVMLDGVASIAVQQPSIFVVTLQINPNKEAITLRIKTFSITTFSIKGLHVTLRIHNAEHKQHSVSQSSATMLVVIMLGVTFYLLLC